MVKTQETNELEAADNGRFEQQSSPAKRASLSQGALIGIAAVVAVATGVIGFVSGIQFQKGNSSSSVANQQGGFGGQSGMGGMGMRNGSFGEVTAVSDSSITITTRERFNQNNSSSTSTSKTFTINSSTTVTVGGSSGSVSDIKTGDTVMIETGSSDSSVAASIRVGMGGAPTGQTQSADTTSSET